MKVSREQMAENRRRLLDAASRLFRARGFETVTVAEVMKEAGLTHGGFYGHFASKDELIARTLAHALAAGDGKTAEDGSADDVTASGVTANDVTADGVADGPDLDGYAAAYLSTTHRDDLAGGCPTAALAVDALRQTPAARAAMTDGLRRQIERLSARAPGADPAARRRAAIGAWAAMVGAIILARTSDDPALSDEVLAETQAWLAARRAEG
jgi:TetR/AcrR family transcriptional regulator, transcriptional repressor for nem operon